MIILETEGSADNGLCGKEKSVIVWGRERLRYKGKRQGY